MQEFSYLDINSALEHLNVAADAAEFHGAMSAVICVNGESGYPIWLGSHAPEIGMAIAKGGPQAQEISRITKGLYQQILSSLQGGNFTFELMIPDDDIDLELRTEAMAHWCQGFLLGLGYSGITDLKQFTGELGEIISDITEISQVSVGQLDYSEDEEQSLTELVEYLRVGVMLFNETLQSHTTQSNTSVH